MHKLAEWIKTSGKTRIAFAESAGISPGMVTRLCNGECSPSLEVMDKIAKATSGGIMPNDFMVEARKNREAEQPAEPQESAA